MESNFEIKDKSFKNTTIYMYYVDGVNVANQCIDINGVATITILDDNGEYVSI